MLIREATLRRIIREESIRVLREAEEKVNAAEMRAAHDRLFTTPQGTVQVGGSSKFSDHELYYNRCEKLVLAAEAALPEGSQARGSMHSNLISLFKSGSRSPISQKMLEVRNANLEPSTKARAILAVLGGFKGPILPGPMQVDLPFDQYLGVGMKSVGYGLTTGEAEKKKIESVFSRFGPETFVNDIMAMASFDVVGETRRVLSGQQQPAGAPAQNAAPAAGAPAKPAARQGPTNWDDYIKVTKNGQQVKSAWDRYATASVPPINPQDFNLFRKWWSDYKRANPGWAGTPVETVGALGAQTRARKAAQ